MKNKVKRLLNNKNLTMPILSFPSTQLIGCSVRELLVCSDMQAKGMQAIMSRCNLSASLNMMDLSVEAECFGAEIKFYENEIPTVTKGAIDSLDDIDSLVAPKVGDGRTSTYIDGVKKVKQLMPDKMIMCGVIGPYSLAGRIFDMTELMMSCYDEPEKVAELLEKVTNFIIDYIKAYKQVGADGVIMAEPASGLLSPDLCKEFSSEYVKRIFDEVSDDDFVVVYHNCGNTIQLIDAISYVNADIYHFGNAINMAEMLELFPKEFVVMGNINPVDFRTASSVTIYDDTTKLLKECSMYDNYIISSGCDIPADSKWENIDAYFKAVNDFYS